MATEAGVSTAWARIFFTFGPHEPLGRLVSDIASALVAGQVVETTAGQQERDYLYVADVASALVALTGSNLTGTINIASGESVPVRRIVDSWECFQDALTYSPSAHGPRQARIQSA